MKVVCTIEARMGSTRLPGKMMEELVDGKSTLEVMVERLSRAEYPDELVIATSTEDGDDEIARAAKSLGVECFRGSEEDVLSRIMGAAREYEADFVCETTGDCPLLDPSIVDQLIACCIDNPHADYVSNVLVRRWPHGFDVETFPLETIEYIDRVTDDPRHREHVTTYIYENSEEFTTINISPPPRLDDPTIRITLDYPEDIELLREALEILYSENPEFSACDVVSLFNERPELREINQEYVESGPQ